MCSTLKSFHLRNFKSYKDADFNLSPVTVIVGENASGKTNALEALRFMKRLAQGIPSNWNWIMSHFLMLPKLYEKRIKNKSGSFYVWRKNGSNITLKKG